MRILLSIFSILIIGCNLFGQVDTIYWPNGIIKEVKTYSSVDKYDVVAYHSNGQIHFKGHVELWSNLDFRPNIEEAYDIKGNRTIVNGEGILYCYYIDLKPQSTSHFQNYALIGDYEEYFPNGKLKILGNYGGSNGQSSNYKQGVWKFYNEKGELCEERKYVNGNEYYLNFWFNGKQILKDGNGRLKLFYDSGILKAEGTIKDSKKWGNWVEYTPNKSILNKIRYTKWTGTHSNEISFKLTLLDSYDTIQNLIGKNGTGYLLEFRNDGTLEMKKHLTSNSVDSIITYYQHGSVFKKISVDRWYETTIECYYPNNQIASKRVDQNESHYWDENGNLSSIVKQFDSEDGSDSYKVQTIKYYPNGMKKEIEDCIIKTVPNEYGEMLIEFDCKSKYWDESGNEINKP